MELKKIELQAYECPDCGGCGMVGWCKGYSTIYCKDCDRVTWCNARLPIKKEDPEFLNVGNHSYICSRCNGKGYIFDWPERGRACRVKECTERRKEQKKKE